MKLMVSSFSNLAFFTLYSNKTVYTVIAATFPISSSFIYAIAIALLVAVFLLGLILGLFINRVRNSSNDAREEEQQIDKVSTPNTEEQEQVDYDTMSDPNSDRNPNSSRYRYYW